MVIKLKTELKKLQRGSIIKLSFDPVVGHEQSGYRPALVISDVVFHTITGFALCIPITSKRKGLLFEIEIQGKKINGVGLLHGAKMFDLNTRDFVYVEKASQDAINKAQVLFTKIVNE